jgi:hypothetical protein
MGVKIGFSHEDKKMCHDVRKWGAEKDILA